jgi:hypothetical protein
LWQCVPSVFILSFANSHKPLGLQFHPLELSFHCRLRNDAAFFSRSKFQWERTCLMKFGMLNLLTANKRPGWSRMSGASKNRRPHSIAECERESANAFSEAQA